MKFKIYALMSLLLLLVSCAEEGPFTEGRLECSFEVSSVTPTTAIITLYVPKGGGNLLAQSVESNNPHVRLSSTPYSSNRPSGTTDPNIRIEFIGSDVLKLAYTYLVSNLTPNTTYYVAMENYDILGGRSKEYAPGYSFKTAPEGDYSGLGDITCEVIGLTETTTTVLVSLPTLLFTYEASTLMASKSPEITDPVVATNNYRSYGGKLSFTFEDLEKTTYYFQLKGKFQIANPSSGSSVSIIDEDIELSASNSVNIGKATYTTLTGEVDFSGTEYSIFKVRFPEDIAASTNSSFFTVTWNLEGETPKTDARVMHLSTKECYIGVPQGFRQGNAVKLTLTGYFGLTEIMSLGMSGVGFMNTFDVHVDMINLPVEGGLVNFNLQRDVESNEIYLVCNCMDRSSFKFTYGTPNLYCYASMENINAGKRLFQLEPSNYSEDKIYYNITSQLAALEVGKTYYLRFDDLSLIYNDLTINFNYSTFFFKWKYEGLPEDI